MNVGTGYIAAHEPGAFDPLTGEQVRLLGEIGFMAAGSGKRAPAELIFHGLMILRPDRAGPYIGLAMAAMNGRDFDAAIRILRDEGLPCVRDNTEIRVFLGLALRLASRVAEADRVLSAVTAENPGSTEPEIHMAQEILRGGVKP